MVNLANNVRVWDLNNSLQNIYKTTEDSEDELDKNTYFDLLHEYKMYKMNYAKNIKFDSGVEDLSK